MAKLCWLFSLLAALSCFTQESARATAVSCPDETTLTRKARIALVQAQSLMGEKKNKEAAAVLDDFIQANPDENHAWVAYTLGGLCLELDRPAKALSWYEKTLDFCPAYAPAWQNMARVCFDLKKYNRAGAALEKTWELSGRKDSLLRYQAAVAYVYAKAPEKALSLLTLICSDPNSAPKKEWVTLFVQVAVELKQPQKAVNVVETLLAGADPVPCLFRLAAILYLEMADYVKAAQNLEAYGLVVTLTREEQKLLADLYAGLGIPEKAALNYQKALALKPCQRLKEKEVTCLLDACEYDAALASAQKGLAAYPESRILWRIKGWVHYEKKEFAQATQAFGKAFALDRKDINTLFMQGLCACRAGERDTAGKALRKAAQHDRYKTRALALIHEMESRLSTNYVN